MKRLTSYLKQPLTESVTKLKVLPKGMEVDNKRRTLKALSTKEVKESEKRKLCEQLSHVVYTFDILLAFIMPRPLFFSRAFYWHSTTR
ncbi:CLUMA_CG008045, isoform A [Clunio marinus]|uniref:CLUMA_CG008045, isoform A n=1 Tax=Clunio marinus TaxID=568069 RepID=A0A1J1I6H8_9DIPT|nr:CLUMA_CG008045, isoform A [Clunio marinus]